MKLLSLLVLLRLAPCALATDWPVAPGGSVQAAIDAASSGDTISIDPGTYLENLVIDGKLLTLRASGAPGSAVLDGGDVGPVIHGLNGADVRLEGLTVTHGRASLGAGLLFVGAALELEGCLLEYNLAEWNGGGIWCDHFGTRIVDCVLRWNMAYNEGGGAYLCGNLVEIRDSEIHGNDAFQGGGLLLAGVGALLEDSVIQYNEAKAGAGVEIYGFGAVVRGNDIHHNGNDNTMDGGGVHCMGNQAFFADNLFRENHAFYHGGGVWSSGHRLRFQGNEFRGNKSIVGRGACFASGDDVAITGEVFDDNLSSQYTVYCTGERTVLQGCEITDNRHGGVHLRGSSSIEGCLIEGNQCGGILSGVYFYDGAGGSLRSSIVRLNPSEGHVGGVGIVNSQVELSDVLISNNTSLTGNLHGAGVYVLNSTVLMERCSLADNGALPSTPPGPPGLGTGLFVDGPLSAVSLSDSIVWGNEDGQGGASEMHVSAGSLVVSHSDVRGGWSGAGNIDADPRWVDAAGLDFRPDLGSPCVDRADPGAAPAGTDLFGQPRLLDGDLDGVLRLDMGAYEYGSARLVVSGTPAPGATLDFAIETDLPLVGLVLVGELPGEHFLPPFGALLFDPLGPWFPGSALIPLPQTFPATVPRTLVTPRTLVFQVLALDLGKAAGNLSNAVRLDFP